ncbi:MAG: putative transferase [Candidatus Scalindua rubra]|uniref:Putative transferase n=1 Tax=Candidatus Scalindua rubra TaxID=1872076 RepID=A0A1E3XG18_9BACT|nr:MAG: putative transferase [Candidatus Scalindua rubra]
MQDLLIIGCGSQARYVIDIISNENCNIIGAVDLEAGNMVGKIINDVKIICKLQEVPQRFDSGNIKVILAHGDIAIKVAAINFLHSYGFGFGRAISSHSIISPFSKVGVGCIINPNVVIMPNAVIGNHVIIHSQSVIEHDNKIGDLSNVAPGVSFGGNVIVGERTYIYTGASIIPGVCIGNDCILGSGAVVIKDVKDNEVVAGVPARTIRINDPVDLSFLREKPKFSV